MILYKYISFNTAKAILETSTLGFSCIEDLNDPFEGTSVSFEEQGQISSSIIAGAVRNRMSRGFGVLSLTRTPLNSTMWSHYGDDHRGVVIGIDVDIANLNSTNSSLIPAKFGDVIYTSTKPNKRLPQISAKRLMSVGSEVEAYADQDSELFKRTFLFKASPWSYEEEVRVVKNIKPSIPVSRYSESKFENKSGAWSVIQFQGRPIYCFSIPKKAIKEVYLGCSVYKNVSRLAMAKSEYEELKRGCISRGISVFNVRQVQQSWQLESYIHNYD